MHEQNDNYDKEEAALDKADVIRERFEEEFKSVDRFGITGSSLGHPCPTIRVYVLSETGKRELTAELERRDNSHGFLYFEDARIQIVVTGQVTFL